MIHTSTGNTANMPTATDENNHLDLDASTLDGDDQVIRNAITLSALTCRPIEMHSIRTHGRDSEGLKTSHVAVIDSLAQVSNNITRHSTTGSTSLSFYLPEMLDASIVKTEYSSETSGGLFLISQALYPYFLRMGALAGIDGPICLELSRYTHIANAPSFEHMAQVLNFPSLNLDDYRRGKVIKIDITVLSPDNEVFWPTTQPREQEKLSPGS